jgi:cell division transport system permease protein
LNLSFFYAIREGVDGMRRARLAAVLSILTTTIALVLFGVFVIGTLNLARLVDAMRNRVEFEVFIDNGLEESGIERVGRDIRKIVGVEQAAFVSREEATKIFRQAFGDDFLDVVENNPLPLSFRISLAKESQNAREAERIAGLIEKIEGVDEVVYRRELLAALDKYIGLAVTVDLILGVVVCLSSFVLVVNVIRLSIAAKRRIIETMQLVGATHAFVRRPFLLQGFVQGLLGGCGAVLLLKLIERFLQSQFGGMILFSNVLYGALLVGGIFLAMTASYFGVRRYLRDR